MFLRSQLNTNVLAIVFIIHAYRETMQVETEFTHHSTSLSSSSLRNSSLKLHSEPMLDRIMSSVPSGTTGLSCVLLADSTACLNSYEHEQ